MEFKKRLSELQIKVEKYLSTYLAELKTADKAPGLHELIETICYSLDGGARIRPMLSLLTAETLNRPEVDVLGFGCAIELIHSYSLIHDDLPCMDDDDFRRGRPSSHKAYGEALAVLAGDAMSTEAFLLLSKKYSAQPSLALALITDLARASGLHGMVGGQAADLLLRNKRPDVGELEFLHRRKTGALLKSSVLGAAKICEASADETKALEKYAEALGLTFQIADDIADSDTNQDEASFVKTVGIEDAKLTCKKLISDATEALAPFGDKADGLRQLISYVFERT